MYKEIVFSGLIERDGRPYRTVYPVYPGSSDTFRKTAEANDLDPELKAFVETLKPDPNCIYVVAVALGAGESWSSNVNGDYFAREDLVKNHQTFVQNGRVYHLHDNSPNSKSFGQVVYSRFNPRMDRVELVFTICRSDMPDVVARIERGETVDVSMGTKVDFDVCSICGNKAKRFSEYCQHLKYEMNKIMPDGRKVYAENPDPRFFDISIVDVGADRTAKVLAKVAAAVSKTAKAPIRIIHSAALGEKISSHKESALDKGIDPVVKALPDKLKIYWERLGQSADSCGGDIDPREFSHDIPTEDILNLFTDNDVVLRPQEFSSMLFDRMSLSDMADEIFGGREILSSPVSMEDVPIHHRQTGTLPLPLPNRFSVERRMGPGAMSLRFRMIAGGPVKTSGSKSFKIRQAKSNLETGVVKLYRSYVKQASKRIIKKANLELLGLIPNILLMSVLGKAFLEGPGRGESPERQHLMDVINGSSGKTYFGSSDILGVPTKEVVQDLGITQSQLQEAAKKQVDLLNKVMRGADPEQLEMHKLSRASLAPVHVLANCFNMLKLSGVSEEAAAREVSKLSPAATALALSFSQTTSV